MNVGIFGIVIGGIFACFLFLDVLSSIARTLKSSLNETNELLEKLQKSVWDLARMGEVEFNKRCIKEMKEEKENKRMHEEIKEEK